MVSGHTRIKRWLQGALAWRPGGLARAGGELFGWFLLRAAAQAAMIICLARSFGATQYGSFVVIIAVAGLFAQLAGLGLPGVLLRDGARTPQGIRRMMSRASALTWRGILVCSALAIAIFHWVLPIPDVPALAVGILVVAEIACSSLIELISRAIQAAHQTRRYGMVQAGLPIARLAAFGALHTTGLAGLAAWMWAYVLVSTVYVAVTSSLVPAGERKADGTSPPQGRMAREGIPFLVGGLSARLQAEYNKPLLAHVAFSQAGYFSVAQRLIEVASLPLLALQEALWPRLYASEDHRRRLLAAGSMLVLMSLGIAAITVATSALLPLALGEEYRPASTLTMWLSGLPVLVVLRNLGNFHLITTGRSHLLTWVYLGGTLTGVLCATTWIPQFSLKGAALACYASELASLLFITVLATRRT